MCGRFTAKNPNLIGKACLEEFDLHGPSLPARYNIGPGQLLLTIASDETGHPRADSMKWGLVPFWDKGDKPKLTPIIARSEEVLTKRVFSSALQKRRCVVPADGFYEWKKLGENLKEPHYIQLKGGSPFYIAGIFEPGVDGRPATVAILTTRPNSLMEKIHDRMPVILRAGRAQGWLKPGAITSELLSRFTTPIASEDMEEWPVSKAVGKTTNDGPELIQPVAAGQMIVEKPDGEQLPLL